MDTAVARRTANSCLLTAPDGTRKRRRFAGGDDVSDLLPTETVMRVRDEIQACLARFPGDGEKVDLSGLPHAFPWLLGFFGDELLGLMIALRYEVIEERKCNAAERASMPHGTASVQ